MQSPGLSVTRGRNGFVLLRLSPGDFYARRPWAYPYISDFSNGPEGTFIESNQYISGYDCIADQTNPVIF